MARMYPGSRMPGRRLQPNPHTTSGRPLWGTFASLDYIATTTELRRNGVGNKGGTVARPPRRLDRSNLCHRCKPEIDGPMAVMRRHYDEARKLSLRLDRTDVDSPMFDIVSTWWGKHIRALLDHRQHQSLKKLIHMEQVRGQVRTKNALRSAGIVLN